MHPRMVAPVLPDFAQAWCQALYEIRDNEEKDSAFRGLCTLVQVNPMGIAKVRRLSGFVNVFIYGMIFYRVYCGSATPLCAGTNHRRNSTRCSRHCWWVSRPTTRKAGQRKYKRSLPLFRNVSHSATVSDHYQFRLSSISSIADEKLASRAIVCTTSRPVLTPCLGLSLRCTTKS